MKRIIAMLLCICMVLSFAACGAPAKMDAAQPGQDQPVKDILQVQDPEEMDREQKELVAELIGGQDASDLTDAELDAVVQQLVGTQQKPEEESFVVNLGASQKTEAPAVDVTQNPEIYDENGAMKAPFDQVYPELIETEQVSFSGESILVKLPSETLTDGLKAAGVGALEKIVPLDSAAWYEAKLIEGADAKDALDAVRELDEVLLAEFNYEVHTAALDDYKHFDKEKDEEFKKNGHNKDQWHFHHCGIVDGYETMEHEGGDASVIVAVIDSGVDYEHEDLKDNMWVNADEIPGNNIDDDQNGYVDDYYGVDIVAGKGNGGDTNGHGTHVAGIIAARNNNVGVLGIAYNVKIMSVKAAMHNGTLNQADIAKAILYAYENGAEVINMSFGGSACSIAVQDALYAAYDRCVLVASAGNDGENNEPTPTDSIAVPNYPAALTYVLGVMSVDEAGRESVFTNWDVKAFNNVEYELYAPGENIMSTLPGNKYGFLSGTSMAAPMVSAFAAILRSEFADRDKYPTKFIYGQLASTSGVCADCLNPAIHGQHNLPQVADLHAALTQLPKPELNVQDYALFDDPKYSEKNNGDGVIDAGETVALGLILQNRWGMSENTQVTVDTLSQAGLSDPYITVKNPTVNYGSVGTYSTQDCGKIYTDGLLTGWEDPFMLEISEDCPNDYRFTLNVTVTCENALDEADETVYTTYGAVDENVRAGYILPSVIDEDMVLTKDNLYIIPNATVIQEGVTVKVMPGTRIQFWSDDAADPYADNYIAYLQVNGKFLVEGTKEEPVLIYPSELMSAYTVEIGGSETGYVSMKYADITNFFNCGHTSSGNRIDLADHCTFRINYSKYLYERYLYNGVVQMNLLHDPDMFAESNLKDCVFYKIDYTYGPGIRIYHSTLDRCIFVDCGIQMQYSGITNSVFLGNYGEKHALSTVVQPAWENTEHTLRTAYCKQTGTTYVRAWYEIDPLYLEKLGGKLAIVETAEELRWLEENILDPNLTVNKYLETHSGDHTFGTAYNGDRLVWSDGSPIGAFLDPDGVADSASHNTPVCMRLENGQTKLIYNQYNTETFKLYEIPGEVLPWEITFDDYEVTLDTRTQYQLAPISAPVDLENSAYIYESSDKTVLTVSETGLVTPTGVGTADVVVYSRDKAVQNYVTFTVLAREVTLEQNAVTMYETKSMQLAPTISPNQYDDETFTYESSDDSVAKVDENGVVTAVSQGTARITVSSAAPIVPAVVTVTVDPYCKPESIAFTRQTAELEVGDTLQTALTAAPENATLFGMTYVSDNEDAVQVDKYGKLTAVGSGVANITVSCEGLTATMQVVAYQKATRLSVTPAITAVLADQTAELPQIITDQGADLLLTWRSTDEDVAVIEDGKLVLKSAGTTAVIATDSHSGLSAACLLVVTEEESAPIKDVLVNNHTGYLHFVLLEDGRLYTWDSNYRQTPVQIAEGVLTIDIYYDKCVAVMENGEIRRFDGGKMDPTWKVESSACTGWKIKGFSRDTYSNFVLTESGNVYAWSTQAAGNSYGQLGVGTTTHTETPTLVNLDGVVDVRTNGSSRTYFLTDKGELYVAGNGYSTIPQLIATNVKELLNDEGTYLTADGRISEDEHRWDLSGYDRVAYDYYYGMAVRDGKVYQFNMESAQVKEVPGITDAVDVFMYQGTHYVELRSGILLAFGDNTSGANHIPGQSGSVSEPVPILLETVEADVAKVTDSGLTEGVLTEETLTLTFNKELSSVIAKLYADGVQITLQEQITDYNCLTVSRSAGFAEGVNYELVIPAASVYTTGGATNPEEIRIAFTYQAPETQPQKKLSKKTLSGETEPVTPVVHKSQLDTTVWRHHTMDTLLEKLDELRTQFQVNDAFYGNAILNPTATDTNVSHWFRPVGYSSSVYKIPFGGNWWGTTNQRTIELQMVDYTDFISYSQLMYDPYLMEAPENTYPFVTSVTLFNKYGEEVTTVGNEQIRFQVKFNRDMDTSIPLTVRFGSAYPYGDYTVEGQYVDARTWEGTYTLNTLIENGNHYFGIYGGCSATEDLELQPDNGRFGFEIDTTAAQALIMQGTATDTGIRLSWTQDDFDTLMGYNVYRATSEDGYYTRLNSTVIPADTMTFFDDTVEPGVIYYYNFTVVKTDMAESEPSGKIVIMSKDTMAPNIYHSLVTNAFTGANLVLSATITDNLNVAYANLYYRIVGTDTWNTIRMNKLNDKYSAIIPAQYVTVAGIEYYIEAFDGVSYTYKGSAEVPYTIAVQEAVGADAMGDVDGDGVITNLDALLLLYTINDKYNMTAEEFARADLNGDGVLWAAEALRILQYVSGVVGSVKM